MGERKSISKKSRFEIFKRDGFTCQYCGRYPPTVVLELDHIIAVASSGTDQIDNLTTACFDCNRGKGAGDLTVAPLSVAEKAEMMVEKRDQLRALERLLKQERRRVEKDVDRVEDAMFPEGDRVFTESFRDSVRMFLGRLPAFQVISFAELSARRLEDAGRRPKYLCGCCWHVVNGTKPKRWRRYAS